MGTDRRDFFSQKAMVAINLKTIQKKSNESGQSMIEFLMTFVFSIGVLLIFVHHSMNSAVGLRDSLCNI